MEKKTKAAYDCGASSVRIDENGKASDMDFSTVMSQDGCNPVSRDRELARAQEGKEDMRFPGMLFPGMLPGAVPSELPGSVPGTMPPLPPAFFPGSGANDETLR